MRNWLVAVTAAGVLAACGGGADSGTSGGDRNSLAAEACRQAAESRLEGKLYEMDLAVLGGSMAAAPNDEFVLKAPITIEPGLTSEVKQTVECTVRFTEGKAEPDVVGFLFNW